jgi:hypothetical protein
MATGPVNGLLEYIHPAQDYLRLHFGVDAITARKVVEDVLLELFRNGPEKLRRPKRHFFHACRIRAFQILRSRRRRDVADAVVEKRRKEAEKKDNVVLIALEDKDKPKFFGQAKHEPKEALNVILEGDGTSEVTATLETPGSTVRMRLHLIRKKLDPTG